MTSITADVLINEWIEVVSDQELEDDMNFATTNSSETEFTQEDDASSDAMFDELDADLNPFESSLFADGYEFYGPGLDFIEIDQHQMDAINAVDFSSVKVGAVPTQGVPEWLIAPESILPEVHLDLPEHVNEVSEEEEEEIPTEMTNSPTKLQSASEKTRSTVADKALLSAQFLAKPSATELKKPLKRKRSESKAVYPKDDAFSFSDSEEEQELDRTPKKRRRVSKSKNAAPAAAKASLSPCMTASSDLSSVAATVIVKDALTPPSNLIRKKYLIQMCDPRFIAQAHDHAMRTTYFEYEEVLRVVEAETDADIEIF